MQELGRRLGRLFAVLCMVSVFPALFPGVPVGDITQLLALQSDLKEVPWKLDFCYGCPWGFCPCYLWLTHIFKNFLFFFLLFFIIMTIFFSVLGPTYWELAQLFIPDFFCLLKYTYMLLSREACLQRSSPAPFSLVYFTCSLISRQAVSIYMPLSSV